MNSLSKNHKKLRFSLSSSLLLSSFGFLSFSPTLAQVIPDQTLGTEGSTVTPNVLINGIPSDRIDGGAIRGPALFHSFQDFNVGNGQGVYFSNPLTIQTIFTRVTGPNVSNILGTLGVLGPANLFLINPHGILFGPNARLDLSGSFFASSADRVLFNNGLDFSASNPQPAPLLSVNIPIGLQFRDAPGTLSNQSIATTDGNAVGLAVSPGQTLGLVGGNLQLQQGILTAPQGQIQLGSVGGNSLVNLNPDLSLNYQGVPTFQDIQLSQGAIVNTSGDGGGRIQVQGRQVLLQEGAQIRANNTGVQPGGNLSVIASELVEIRGRSADITQTPSSLQTKLDTNATGTGGQLTVITPQLRILEGGRVTTTTEGQLSTQTGGSLTVIAPNSVEIMGFGLNQGGEIASSALTSETFSQSQGGRIEVTTNRLILANGGQINASTAGLGSGGEITVNANQIWVGGRAGPGHPAGILARAADAGAGGNITLNTNSIQLESGSRIGVASQGIGNGGTLTVKNAAQVIANGPDAEISARAQNRGDGGTILLETQQLNLQNGAQVVASTTAAGNARNVTIRAADIILGQRGPGNEPTGILARVEDNATGQGGNILIDSQNVLLTSGARISVASQGSGDGGMLTLRNTGTVEVQGPDAEISARAQNRGDGGSILLETQQLRALQGGQVVASTSGAGNGQNLSITAANIELRDRGFEGTPSGIFARVEEGATGNAGNIKVQGQQLQQFSGSRLTAASLGQGAGGNLDLNNFQTIIVNGPDSEISARSQSTGDGGSITINSQSLNTFSGGQVNASTTASGDAGNIFVTADQIRLSGRSPDQTQPSGILARVEGTTATGNANSITINSDQLQVESGARLTAASQTETLINPRTQGRAGSITVNAGEEVQITDQGEISVRSANLGLPGNINLTTENLRLDQEGSLSAASVNREGGSISVTARDIRLLGGSQISAESGAGTQEGNIDIRTELLVLLEGSQIRTDALDPGGGANVQIRPLDDSLTVIKSLNSVIRASGNLNIESNLNVQPPELADVTVIDPADLIAQNPCSQGDRSEFLITGRGGLPPTPHQIINQAPVRVDLVAPAPGNQSRGSVTPSGVKPDFGVPATGWIRNANGEVWLVGYNPSGEGAGRPLPAQWQQHCHL